MSDDAREGLLLGIDLGTQSTRVGLFTPGGRLVDVAVRQQSIMTPKPGWSEQDANDWWTNVASAIREVLAAGPTPPEAVSMIGCGGQMHGPVPLRSDGSVASSTVQLWNDKRPAHLVEELRGSDAGQALYDITANPPATSWTGFKIQWLARHDPQVFDETSKFLVPKDFINYRLTGIAATDTSEASGSYLLDAETRSWSPSAMSLLGIDPATLPDVHPSTAVIGEVETSAAAETGLMVGTPVVAGGGDMLCTLLAAGLWRPGAASDITGTSSILSVFSSSPIRDPRVMNLYHLCDGWVPFGILDSGGLALRWFRDQLGQDQVRQSKTSGADPYEVLIRDAAQTPPGAEGLLFLPHLLGERTLGSAHSRGALVGLTPRHGQPEIVRAIMEGVTFELRRSLEIIERPGNEIREVIHSGGGAVSGHWSQLKADIYQRPVTTLSHTEGGLYGAAMLAATGAGFYNDPAEAASQGLVVQETYEPRSEHAERYDELFEIFVDVHDRLQDPFSRIATSESIRG